MRKGILFIFIFMLTVGTPWLSMFGKLATSALSRGQESSVIVKGLLASDAEERAEEEDSRELEEDDDESCKLLPKFTTVGVQSHDRLGSPHLFSHFKSHPQEILVPPPQV